MMHTDSDLLKAGKALAEMVLDTERQCDLSKLNDIELQRIKQTAAQARMVLADYREPEEIDEIEGLTK